MVVLVLLFGCSCCVRNHSVRHSDSMYSLFVVSTDDRHEDLADQGETEDE